MGRKSREKRERRERGDGPVAELVAAYSTASLLHMIEAASVSPISAHRAPSFALLFEAVIRRRRPGTEPVDAAALPTVAAGVAEAHPELYHREDFQPYDPRAEVLVPLAGDLFRLLPGAMERPTQVVRQHELLASVIDPVLVDKLGFGLADAGELILRRLDQVASALAPAWPDGPLAAIGDDATITDEELAAAATIKPIDSLVDECRNPDAASRALNRYTTPSRRLTADVFSMFAPSTFGTAIAVRHGRSTVALPAGMLPEVLTAIGNELASVALRYEPKVDEYWLHTVGNRIGFLLQGTGHRISGPVRVGPGAPIHSLVWFDDRRILAIGNTASLAATGRQERLDASAREILRVRPGVTVQSPDREWTIPADSQVLHLQVMAGPMHSSRVGLMLPAIGLDDLEWIIYTEGPNRDDLWFFIRDLTSTPGIRDQAAWDLIDRWEVWRPNKSFYRGAMTVDLMTFAAHSAAAEWDDAAEATPIERALHQLGMRPLRDWPCIDLDRNAGTEVGDLRTDEMVHVIPVDVPAGVDRIDPTAPRIHSETLWRLSMALDWKLDKAHDAYLDAASRSGLAAVRIRFAFEDRDDGPALTVAKVDQDGNLTIGWDARLQLLLAADSYSVEANLGRVVAELFVTPYRDAFIAAWEMAPPGIRVDAFNVQQQARELPEPLKAHEALGVDVLRDLAAALRADGVEAGEYTGHDATALESDRVFPWLLAVFHERIAELSADQLLRFAMTQLECANNQRATIDRRLGWARGFPVRGRSGVEDRREENTRVTRVLSLILEEVLAHPPPGDRPVDATSWADLLVVAELCVESCFRSEAIHRRLHDITVVVSDMFEITIRSSNDPTDVDMTAYTAARAAATMPTAIPIATEPHLNPEPDTDDLEPHSVVETRPNLEGIDVAMRQSLGFGIDALVGVLNVAVQWDASVATPVTRASRDEFVDSCIDPTTGATRDEYLTALDWLTLRGDDLDMETIPHWETERRARRIAVCPFVDAGDGHVWVLPWTVESSRRILANYLHDGRLPWPSSALPTEVTEGLGTYRQAQNKQLEEEINDALKGHGFVVRSAVKPEKKEHYGLAYLSGEVDTLCIDPARSRIWVIEAKDPYIPFSARQIRRQIDVFHKTNGYVDKLLQKVEEVAASASSVAKALRVDGPGRAWEVVGLAVTRRVDPAAFALEPRIPFCVVDDVIDVVDSDDKPEPGFHDGPTDQTITGSHGGKRAAL